MYLIYHFTAEMLLVLTGGVPSREPVLYSGDGLLLYHLNQSRLSLKSLMEPGKVYKIHVFVEKQLRVLF
jgi:hypothetical protein